MINSGFQREVLVQILNFPIHSIHFHFSLSSRKGEVSHLRETFSPKSPSRMTPETVMVVTGILESIFMLQTFLVVFLGPGAGGEGAVV